MAIMLHGHAYSGVLEPLSNVSPNPSEIALPCLCKPCYIVWWTCEALRSRHRLQPGYFTHLNPWVRTAHRLDLQNNIERMAQRHRLVLISLHHFIYHPARKQ